MGVLHLRSYRYELKCPLEWFDETAATLLANRYQSQVSKNRDQIFNAIEVHLTLRLTSDAVDMRGATKHLFGIPEVRDDFRFLWDDTRLDGILDSIAATEPVQGLTPKPLYDLSLYKASLCPTYDVFVLISKFDLEPLPSFLCLHVVTTQPRPMHTGLRLYRPSPGLPRSSGLPLSAKS